MNIVSGGEFSLHLNCRSLQLIQHINMISQRGAFFGLDGVAMGIVALVVKFSVDESSVCVCVCVCVCVFCCFGSRLLFLVSQQFRAKFEATCLCVPSVTVGTK